MWLYDKAKEEGAEIRKAPIGFALILLIGTGLGWGARLIWDQRQLDILGTELNAAKATIGRLSVAEIPNKTALTELTNKELKERAKKIYEGIRKMNVHYTEREDERRKQEANKEITKKKADQLWHEDNETAGREYERNFRVGASVIYKELQNRIPPERRNHLVGLPDIAINPDDKRGGSVNLRDIVTGPFAFGTSGQLARNIEELTKLLPDD